LKSLNSGVFVIQNVPLTVGLAVIKVLFVYPSA